MDDTIYSITQRIICEAVEFQDNVIMRKIQEIGGEKYEHITIDKNKVVEALKKQIPKQPLGDYHSVPHYRCPSCGKAVKTYANSVELSYCGWCGQALDWNDM